MLKYIKAHMQGIFIRLIVYLVASGLPVLLKYVLLAKIPLVLVLLLPGVKIFFVEIGLRKLNGKLERAGRVASTLFSVVFAVVLVATIVITPYAAYQYFFDVFSRGNVEELYVGNIFVLLGSLLSLVFCTAVLRERSYTPFLGLLCMLFGLALLVFQSVLLFVCLIVTLGLYAAVKLKARIVYTAGAFGFCTLLALLCYVISPEPQGSALVEQLMYPGLRRSIIGLFPDFPLLMDIPGYGLTYGATKLGGSTLLTSTPILEVKSDVHEALYLKTNVYDVYTGKSWQNSSTVTSNPQPAESVTSSDAATKTGFLDLKILSEAFFNVPTTLDTIGFEYRNSVYPVNGNVDWPGIVFKNALGKNQSIRLLRAQSLPAPGGDDTDYLQIPDGFPERVRDLANALCKGAGSEEEILERIQAFLSVNDIYNLQASSIKGDEDFVTKFLFDDKRGYCTHFASAFVILARLSKIPARYATGYLVYISGDRKSKVVTARSAHAWPEIRTSNRGWISLEATAAVNLQSYARMPYEFFGPGYFYRYLTGDNSIARNPTTLRQLEELLGIRLQLNNDGEKGRQFSFNFKSEYLLWLLVPGLLCIIFILVIAGRRIVRNRDPRQRVRHMVTRIVNFFKDAPPPETSGWIQWQKNVRAMYGLEQERTERLLFIILKIAYSNRAVSKEETEILATFKRP